MSQYSYSKSIAFCILYNDHRCPIQSSQQNDNNITRHLDKCESRHDEITTEQNWHCSCSDWTSFKSDHDLGLGRPVSVHVEEADSTGSP